MASVLVDFWLRKLQYLYTLKILIWSKRVAPRWAMTQLLVSAIAFIVFRLRFLLRPTDELEILLNSTKLHICHFLIAPFFQVCNYQPPCRQLLDAKMWRDCDWLPSTWWHWGRKYGFENFANVWGPLLLLASPFEGKKFQQECIEGRIPQYCLR